MAWWIFQNVVITTALAAVVFVICRTGRIGPVARHALWVLVLVKFITPPLVVWPWAAPDPFGLASPAERPGAQVRPYASDENPPLPTTGPAAADGLASASPRTADAAMSADGRRALSPPVPSPAGLAALPWTLIIGLWVAGSAGLLLIEAIRLIRLAQSVKTASRADAAIVTRVAEMAAHMGLRPLDVVAVAGIASPAVWGFGRPRLLWPESISTDATDACIDGLVVHELAHVKRGDHLVGWLELAAGVVWWWNPLFWSVRSALREQAELACDAWVISALPNGRRAYAESLLALSGAAVRTTSSMAVIGVRATSRRVLERRLVMIMKGRAPLRLPLVGSFCLALIAAATLPAWATAQQPPPPPPVPAVRPAAPPTPAPPPPPPVPARFIRARPVAAAQVPPPPPTPATPRVAAPARARGLTVNLRSTNNLPAEGKQLMDSFDQDVKAIEQEAVRKTDARRESLTRELQALQDQLTKAGKLDEAVAVRDFIRSLTRSTPRYVLERGR